MRIKDGRPVFYPREEEETFLFSSAFRPAVEPKQLPIKWGPSPG
jgi:hypothetical protein